MSDTALAGVSVQRGETAVLDDVTLELTTRTTAVIGENGSGKSTLIRILGGLTSASAGTARVLGLDPVRDVRLLRRRVAVVFSNPDAQIVMPTVEEDIAFSLRPDKLPTEEKGRRVAEALVRFGLAEIAQRPSHELSGGQKQLLALCGAFVREPELVIADEPTAYLDARNARRVADHLLAPGSHRLVMATHDLALAARCESAILMRGGRVAAVGRPEEVIARYEDSLRC
jgi:biotin transport system ATP-binding protein